MAYFQRETRELVNLDSCELIQSQFGLASDYWASVALDYFAEISEQLLPSAEPSERFFRLLLAVLDSSAAQGGEGGGVAGGDLFFAVGGAAFGLAAGIACVPRLRERCWTIRSAERAFFSRGQRGPDLRALPPDVGRREQLGIERRVAGDWPRRCCAGRWRRFRCDWTRPPPRICGGFWCSRLKRTWNGG